MCAWSRPRRPRGSSGRRRSPASPARRSWSRSGSRTRCAASFPGDPLPEHAPLSHLALVEHADGVSDRAGDRSYSQQARERGRRQPADRRGARMPATADRRSGHEQRDVRASGDPGEPGLTARAGRDRPGAGNGPARLAGGVRDRPSARTAGAARGHRGRAHAAGNSTGLHVLVSAGGTRGPIDSVRFVGNRSSGRMGLALADEAKRRGAKVTVVAANVSLQRPAGIGYVDVHTAAELADTCAARFETCDVLIMAAAVADYRPEDAHGGKLKKDQTGEELNLRLVRTTDVLSSLAERRQPGQLIVGFAAEHGDERARLRARQTRAEETRRGDRERHERGRHRLRVRRQRSLDRHGHRRAARAEDVQGANIAAAILDAVLSRRSSNDIKVRR